MTFELMPKRDVHKIMERAEGDVQKIEPFFGPVRTCGQEVPSRISKSRKKKQKNKKKRNKH